MTHLKQLSRKPELAADVSPVDKLAFVNATLTAVLPLLQAKEDAES